MEAGKTRITFNLRVPLKPCLEPSNEISRVTTPNLQFCGKNDSNLSGKINVDNLKQVQARHDRMMDRIANKRKPVLKNHCCNPIIMINEEIKKA